MQEGSCRDGEGVGRRGLRKCTSSVGQHPPRNCPRRVQVVRPLHLLGVVSDSLCRRREGSSWLEKSLQMEGLWQRDLRVQTEASICGSQAWEGGNEFCG